MPSPTRITRVAVLVYVPLTLGALLWAWLSARRLPWTLEAPWMSGPYGLRLAVSLGLGLALGLLVVAMTPPLLERARWARALHQELREIIGPLSGRDVTLLALSSGFAEEIFFRGAMQPVLGLVLTSMIFGAVHVGPKRVFLVWATWAAGMGLLFGLIFELTAVLWGPILAHVWINHRNMSFIRRH